MSEKKLHNLEEMLSKKNLSKIRKHVSDLWIATEKVEFDAHKKLEGLSKKEFVKLKEWSSLVLKASYLFSKDAEKHLDIQDVEFWKVMYEQAGSLYLLCRESRNMASSINALSLMCAIMSKIHSLGGNYMELDTDMIKKGWQKGKEHIEDGIDID